MPGDVFLFHGDELRGPDFSTDEDKLAFILRRACHLLIDRIDNRGLQEACESLAEFYEYYKPTERSHALLSEPRTLDRLTVDQSPVIRRIMPAVEEQPFQISED